MGNKLPVAYAASALLLTSCAWHGIHPIYTRIDLHEQERRAEAIVFAEPIESYSLHHFASLEKLPASTDWTLNAPPNTVVRCKAVAKVLKVRQVLRGQIKTGVLITINTYELPFKDFSHAISSSPGIFFLTREAGVWRPFTDFGSITTTTLAGFPNRPLRLAAPDEHSAAGLSVEQVLIDGLLSPENARDWPNFKNRLMYLARIVTVFASYSGLLAREPGLITERLSVLAAGSNPAVARAARKQIIETTSLYLETGPVSLTPSRLVARTDFLAESPKSGKSPEDREYTYWEVKRFTCSNVLQIRAKAEALLHQYFPDRRSVDCEICAAQ